MYYKGSSNQGTAVSKPCPHCGAQIKESSKFCPRCGMSIMDKPITKIKKKKKKARVFMLVGVVCFCLLLIGGAYFYFTNNKDNDNEEDSFEATKEKIEDFEEVGSPYLDGDGYVKPADVEALMRELEAEAKKLESKGEISEYEYDDDNQTLFMKFQGSEIGYLYIPRIEGMMASGDDAYVATYEPTASDEGVGFPELIDNAVDYIVDSNAGEFSLKHEYEDEEVSVDNLDTLKNSEIVIWKGHGGVLEKRGFYLQLGIEYTESLHKQYKKEFKNNNLVAVNEGGVAVSEKYLDKYLDADAFEGCIVYIGSCCSAKLPKLKNIVMEHGATAFIGNSNVVTCVYNAYMIEDFCKAYATPDTSGEYRTISEAMDVAREENGQCDSYITKETLESYDMDSPSEVVVSCRNDCTIEELYQAACPNAVKENTTPSETPQDGNSNLTYQDVQVDFERVEVQDPDNNEFSESCVLTAHDLSGNVVWSYTSDKFPLSQNYLTDSICQIENQYIYAECLNIVSRDVVTGEVLWTNTDFQSTILHVLVNEETQRIYLSGDLGPDLMCITTSGETVDRIEYFSPDYNDIFYMNWHEMDKNYLEICYSNGPDGYLPDIGYSFTVDAMTFAFEPL